MLRRYERGHAAVLAVLVCGLLLVAVSAALTAGAAGLKYCREHADKTKVYAIAEAGVESVLARALRDGGWLWGLKKGESAILPGFNFGGGSVSSLAVKKEGTEPPSPAYPGELVSTSITVTSTGSFNKAHKTLEVKAGIFPPLHFMGGIWCQSPRSIFEEGIRITGNLFSTGSLCFTQSCRVDGDITAGGDVALGEGVELTASRLRAAGSVVLGPGARLDAEAEAQKDVCLEDGALVGVIEPAGDGKSEVIWRDIFYNGGLCNRSGREIDPQKLHPGEAPSFFVPPLPLRSAGYTAKICDRRLEGSAVFRSAGPEDFLDLEGVIFVNGDLEIAGRYRGNATVAAAGDVTVSGDLLAGGDFESLLLISYGPSGITVGEGTAVQALFYAPPALGESPSGGKVILGAGSQVAGGITCGTLEMGRGSRFVYDSRMAGIHPPWHTAAVTVTSWKEQKGVY